MTKEATVKVDPKIWSAFCEKDAKWHNFIIRCVNEGDDPHDFDGEWGEVEQWYYDDLMRQKKEEEENMIRQYGKILFPVTFELYESDT